jgi:hypothetical protein
MIENRLFFLCEGCNDAVPIAGRGRGPYVTPRNADFNAWFRKHARCGETFDHFSLVYEVEPDGNSEVVISQTVPSDLKPDENTH